MNIRHSKSLVALCILVGSSMLGCASKSSTSDADELEGAPELAAVQMPLTGSATSDGAATDGDAVDPATLAADELEQSTVASTTDAQDLQNLRSAVKHLNDSLRDFLGPIAAMIRTVEPDYEVGQLKMWGPVTRGVTQYRFFLRQQGLHQWGWRLDARVADSATVYSRVAAGEIAVGKQARRGAGIMGFDIDALAAVDPTITAQGKILLGFRHGELGTSIAYAVRDLTRDPSVQTGVDGVLRAVHLKDGSNRLRLAYRGNVEGTASDAEELVLARVRHQRSVGGRSDLIVLGGDDPADQAWVVSQCWNQELQSGFREIRSCPINGVALDTCVVTQSQGDVSNCPDVMREPELPPVDPNAPMVDDGDPNSDVVAPPDIPTVEGDLPGG
jgi:hypothetical protein